MITANIAELGVKLETIPGTAESITADDFISVANLKIEPNIAMHEQEKLFRSFDKERSIPGERSGKVTFETPLVGTSEAGNPINISSLLLACGMKETIVAGTSAQYTPATEQIPNITCQAHFHNQKIYKLWGGSGDFSIAFERGKPAIASFDLQFADFSESDGLFVSGVNTTTSVLPPVFLGVNLSLGGYTGAVFSKCELKYGNSINLIESAGAGSGHICAGIEKRDTSFSFDPACVQQADYNFISKWRSGDLLNMTMQFGTVTGNIFSISAPNLQFTKIGIDQRNGKLINQIECKLCISSGDDSLEIQVA